MTPQSDAELVCDQIAAAFFFSTWLASLVPELGALRAINLFQHITWFYIESDRYGTETVTAHRATTLWCGLLLAARPYLFDKIIGASGLSLRLSRFLIVTRFVEST